VLRALREAGILVAIVEASGRRSAVLAFPELLSIIKDWREVARGRSPESWPAPNCFMYRWRFRPLCKPRARCRCLKFLSRFELDEIYLPAERRFDAAMRCRLL